MISVAAFTLTELLVVIAVLALLATTQLPGLTRAKAPARFTKCQNNCRQIGQATMVYKADNNDIYPFGNRCRGPGTGDRSVVDPYAWPMQLLGYLGGYETNVQPRVYVCPSEQRTASDWVFQVHYQANRHMLSDTDDRTSPITGAMVRETSIYWMFIEKEPTGFCSVRAGGLENPVLAAWNYPPGSPGYRRHNGGLSSAAADVHAEWLRTPLYQPGASFPTDFVELGDCSDVPNPGAVGIWNDNGPRVKLYTRRIPVHPWEGSVF